MSLNEINDESYQIFSLEELPEMQWGALISSALEFAPSLEDDLVPDFDTSDALLSLSEDDEFDFNEVAIDHLPDVSIEASDMSGYDSVDEDLSFENDKVDEIFSERFIEKDFDYQDSLEANFDDGNENLQTFDE